MRADRLREILEGTGAEILETSREAIAVHRHEFRLLSEAEIHQHMRAENTPFPDAVARAWPWTQSYDDEDQIREALGGKKLIVRDCGDHHLYQGPTRPAVCACIWPDELQSYGPRSRDET